MYKITHADITSVQKYLTDFSSIYFSSILAGEAEGIIWADKKDDPDFLLIWSDYQEDFQLMGKPLAKEEWAAFRKWFHDIIIPFLGNKGIDTFEYGADSSFLSDMMQEIFPDKTFQQEKQKVFSFSGHSATLPKPYGYEVEKIDQKFLQKDYSNMSYITNEIYAAYGTFERYQKEGYGYAAIKENEITARAVMTFHFGDMSNISVDTVEKHRRKGLSSYLASRTITHALSLHQKPIWDCSEDNTASEKTALKCGFCITREDAVYWFSI